MLVKTYALPTDIIASTTASSPELPEVMYGLDLMADIVVMATGVGVAVGAIRLGLVLLPDLP